MGRFRQTALVAQVWVTAVMTLVAGLPHFDCRCPDGRVKPFCLSFAFETSGCCCSGTCCSPTEESANRSGYGTTPARQAKKAPCCSRHRGPETSELPSANGCRAGGSGCVRTLTQPQDVACAPSQATGRADVAALVAVPASVSFVHALPAAAHNQPSWETHSLAPPVDLVTVLQHLLI